MNGKEKQRKKANTCGKRIGDEPQGEEEKRAKQHIESRKGDEIDPAEVQLCGKALR